MPCRPTSVKASLRCHSNSAAVTWERASGAPSYVALGVTADGSHQMECNNSMSHCDLSDLQCGQTYSVSVFSKDEPCSSMESEKAHVRTGSASMSLCTLVVVELQDFSVLLSELLSALPSVVSQLPAHPRMWLWMHSVMKVQWLCPGHPTLMRSTSM